jgi:16S rRNA processing protein RimM
VPKRRAEHLLVALVGRAVGLKGEVEVHVLSDAEGRFAPGSVVFNRATALTVRSMRRQGERVVVRFESVHDRTAAEGLRGAELTIPPDEARSLEEGEYWDHDLIGCNVITTGGEEIGSVVDVLHQPANSVLVVRGDKEHLVPLVADVVKGVVPGETITIDPLPGLLEE